MSKIVAVFGSARVSQTSVDYQVAYDVGKALAEAGFTVATGGYSGVMEGASKGAREANGTVIGVTMDEKAAFESFVNPYVSQEIRYPTLRERLHHLVDHCDAYIVLSGGVGTLQEIAEAWQQVRMGAVPTRPIVCYGEFWRSLFETISTSSYVGPKESTFVFYASDPATVVKQVIDWYKE